MRPERLSPRERRALSDIELGLRGEERLDWALSTMQSPATVVGAVLGAGIGIAADAWRPRFRP